MAIMRVYASDSYQCPLKSKSDGYDASWTFDESDIRHATTIEASVVYSFLYTWKKPIPGVQSAAGCRMRFDMRAVPALQGTNVRVVRGPFVFLRARGARLEAQNVDSINRWFDLRQIFIIFLSRYPNNPGQYNVLGNAALNAYFDTHGGRNDTVLDLRGGVQTCDVVVGAASCPPYEGKMYTGNVSALFDSHIGVNPPYLEVEYEPAPIEVVGCMPQTGFINEKAVNRFSWAIAPGSSETIGKVTQKSAVLQWREKGAEISLSMNVPGAGMFADIPPNILPNGAVQWRVQALSQGGAQSPFSPWFELTSADLPPLAPTLLSPDGGVRDGAKPITFSWRHQSPLSTPPSAFEIQCDHEDGAGFSPLGGKVLSAASTHTVDAGALRSGVVRWRVRDYNSDGDPSPWSAPARFTLRAAPAPPRVRAIEQDTPRPAVQWLAEDQQAFEVQIRQAGTTVYASDAVFGEQPFFKIPVFLEGGRYRLRLRVQNAFNLWSVWVESDFAINTAPRLALALHGGTVHGGVRLEWETEVVG